MGVGYNPRIVTSGLVLALDAGNTKSYLGSGTTWTDMSGNGNNGTLTNGPTFDSTNGGSVVFDGVDDYVSIVSSTSLSISSDITLSVWVKTPSYNTVARDLISKGTSFGGGDACYYISIFSDGRVFFDVVGVSALRYAVQINAVDTPAYAGKWMNFVGVRNGTFVGIYTNGSLYTSRNDMSENIRTNNANVGVGGQNGIRYFNGNISLASVYNRALTAAEISQNFNASRGRYGI